MTEHLFLCQGTGLLHRALGKSQRTGFGVHTACVYHAFSLRLSFLSENFSGKCPFRDKKKKYPGSGRDLMMSFKKCFVCFISVHLRKGINLSCVVLSAGSRGFPCPWFTGGGRSLHILWSAHPVGLAWSLSFGPRIRCYFWSEDICSQLPTQFNRILRYIC